MKFSRDVLGKEGLENLMRTGRMERRRDRGRQRTTFWEALKEQVAKNWKNDIRASEILHLARDRKHWNIMIVYVCGQGT